MNISAIRSINFTGGASVYLQGFRNGYKDGVNNNKGANYDNDYQTSWERTLYDASYNKGSKAGLQESGKNPYDLKFRSIYQGSRSDFTCNNVFCDGDGIFYDCVGYSHDCSDWETEGKEADKLPDISDEVKALAFEEKISIPDAQDYMDITENNTL